MLSNCESLSKLFQQKSIALIFWRSFCRTMKWCITKWLPEACVTDDTNNQQNCYKTIRLQDLATRWYYLRQSWLTHLAIRIKCWRDVVITNSVFFLENLFIGIIPNDKWWRFIILTLTVCRKKNYDMK